MLKHLIPLIPPHRCYVEVFGGGLAMMLAKEPSHAEVVNDINTDLISFYRCVKYHPDEVWRELDSILWSRKEFEDYIAQPGLTDIQRAARWFVRNAVSFGGMGDTFGTTKVQPSPSKANRLKAIKAISTRLDRACIENLSWEKTLEKYDATETFFFLDPPYFDSGGDSYDGISAFEFNRLVSSVKTLRGRWLFTFQDHPSVREAFSDCDIMPIQRANGIGNRGKTRGRVYHELIIRPSPVAINQAR